MLFESNPEVIEINIAPKMTKSPILPFDLIPHEYTIRPMANAAMNGAPNTSWASRLVPSISAVRSIQVSPK